jgi:hypothetical protein
MAFGRITDDSEDDCVVPSSHLPKIIFHISEEDLLLRPLLVGAFAGSVPSNSLSGHHNVASLVVMPWELQSSKLTAYPLSRGSQLRALARIYIALGRIFASLSSNLPHASCYGIAKGSYCPSSSSDTSRQHQPPRTSVLDA